MKTALAAARSGRGKAKVVKDGLVKVTLRQKIAQSQSTTPLLTASALQPSAADGFTQFAVLYDECRCTGVTINCFAAHSGAGLTMDAWINAFDPAVSGNLSSVTGGMEQKYHTGPIVLPTNTGGSVGIATPTGMQTFTAKTVKSFESGTSNDKIGSNWYPTSVTSSIIGYMKPYVENSGANTVYLTSFVTYHMEFKYRG